MHPSIIKKYIKRLPVEVCFKECKQLLELGKDQSNNFNAQVFATTASFLGYNLLNFLNELEQMPTIGGLFQQLGDESSVITYAQRLREFFQGLFRISLSVIFELFKIEEDCSSCIDTLEQILYAPIPIQGCET